MAVVAASAADDAARRIEALAAEMRARDFLEGYSGGCVEVQGDYG